MRFFYCTMAVCLFGGCQGNTTALHNPFLSPDRVPPPATRMPTPGTAQPYYPGDPVPGNAGTFPPASYGAPAPTYSPAPAAVPPGGWGSPPQSSITPTPDVLPASAEIPLGPVPSSGEPAIQVSVDQQNMRFGQSLPGLASHDAWSQPQPQVALPASYQQQPGAQLAAQSASFQTPVGEPQFVGQAQFVDTPIDELQKAVRLREVKTPSSGSDGVASSDGFRPQGSRLVNRTKAEAENSSGNTSIQAAVAPLEFGPMREDAQRFGFDPQYHWLRGQLQYSQATSAWHLRYIPVQGGVDQFGGQLLIDNPHLLGGLQAGDYVQVQGQLLARPNGTGQSEAVYTVAIVQRQRVQ
ncbi:MAG: hypothetical protein KDA57_10645 [Planctomycetales bacterium]|nr:hypothetical protein [Planctomycetales bacterium]